MSEFKVGDKVTHSDYGEGEIKYGPFDATFGEGKYLAAFAGGKHATVGTDFLTLRPAFKVGDKVIGTFVGGTMTVKAGPYSNGEGAWYTVSDESGFYPEKEANLKPLISPTPLAVGDSIRILEDDHAYATVYRGDVFTVDNGDVYHDGTKFSVDDKHGDPWRFKFSAEGTGWERVTD